MQPGSSVTPNISLVRMLDQGSMGSVWVAEHATLGTQVAVKFMSPEVAKNPNLVTRFSREAHIDADRRQGNSMCNQLSPADKRRSNRIP